MTNRILSFLAITLTALAFVPAAAHLMEMSRKLDLAQHDYFVVQSIYGGWSYSGWVIFGALAANLFSAVTHRGDRRSFSFSIVATVLIGAMLLIFFKWTQPANVATANWTRQPENWNALRHQWEFSHAINALIMFIALQCATIAAIWQKTPR